MLILGFALAGLLLTVLGVAATVRNIGDLYDPAQGRSRWASLVAALAGIGLAYVCYKTRYSYSDTVRIWGFPFFAAAFEKDGESWLDFVGPMTGPASIANALFGFVLPQLMVRIARRRRSKGRGTNRGVDAG
jgi:hypothetical protein